MLLHRAEQMRTDITNFSTTDVGGAQQRWSSDDVIRKLLLVLPGLAIDVTGLGSVGAVGVESVGGLAGGGCRERTVCSRFSSRRMRDILLGILLRTLDSVSMNNGQMLHRIS